MIYLKYPELIGKLQLINNIDEVKNDDSIYIIYKNYDLSSEIYANLYVYIVNELEDLDVMLDFITKNDILGGKEDCQKTK
jgi:hypothetical protein